MIIFVCFYLVIGVLIATVMWRTLNLGISSEKYNLNKYEILAIKILISVGMTMCYPIIIFLIGYGINKNKS